MKEREREMQVICWERERKPTSTGAKKDFYLMRVNEREKEREKRACMVEDGDGEEEKEKKLVQGERLLAYGPS